MELLSWNKGVQGIKYLCDECSETVNEREVSRLLVLKINKFVSLALNMRQRRKRNSEPLCGLLPRNGYFVLT